MRITIGGVLLVGGVIAVAVLGPLSGPDNFVKQAFEGVMSLTKGSPSPVTPPAPTPVVANPAPVVVAAVAPLVSTPTVLAPVPAASQVHPSVVVTGGKVAAVTAAQPAVAPVVETPAPEKNVHRRHRRSRRVKAAAPASAPDKSVTQLALPKPKAAATSSPTDPLIGKYVAVKLKSGREVKGVLRARSWEGLTLEIPGMGPFQYPTSNIDGVKAAE